MRVLHVLMIVVVVVMGDKNIDIIQFIQWNYEVGTRLSFE